jgi:hypothetical protein
MRNAFTLVVIGVLMAALAVAQTAPAQPITTTTSATALASVTLPTYIMAGVSFNQITGGAGFVSAIIPESNAVGLYGSATTDLVPLKTTVNGKSIYVLNGSARAGQHKVVYQDTKNAVLIGGDIGASFSNPSAGTPGVTLGVAGSFTLTYVRQINAHLAVGVPVRMLYMSNVGANGTGAWNPVVEFGLVWKP